MKLISLINQRPVSPTSQAWRTIRGKGQDMPSKKKGPVSKRLGGLQKTLDKAVEDLGLATVLSMLETTCRKMASLEKRRKRYHYVEVWEVRAESMAWARDKVLNGEG